MSGLPLAVARRPLSTAIKDRRQFSEARHALTSQSIVVWTYGHTSPMPR